MKLGACARALGMIAALLVSAPASAQQFSGADFQINRERVQFGSIKACAKNATYLVPTTYLFVTARNSLFASSGLGSAGAKARVYVEGLTKSELQGLAGGIQNDIVGKLRDSGYSVLTFDDVKADVADKARMQPNPKFNMTTRTLRNFGGIDFFVAAPSDEQTLDYGLAGPHDAYIAAAKRTGATLLVPEIYMTMPQLGASASKSETLTWKSSSASISFSPAMKFAGGAVWGLTAKGSWCNIVIPEHGMRLPAPVAGEFKELDVVKDDYGDWSIKRGDFTFIVDDAAFQTGVHAVGNSLADLIADTMNGKK